MVGHDVYPRVHIEFIVQGQDDAISFVPFEFQPQEDNWQVIREQQQRILSSGAKSVNTCHYRTLLDMDGYRK